MNKNDLKSLANQLHKDLLASIESYQHPSKEDMIDFLQDAVLGIQKMDEAKLDSTEQTKLAFKNAYKEIAKSSLESYKFTNKKFEEISNLNEKALLDFNNKLIDTTLVEHKFNDIQDFMLEEVQKANNIIADLTKQVEDLEKTSNLDGLTKIFNRRALDNFLEQVCEKQTLKHDLHLLLLDIDDFKLINDRHGHIAGDKILIFISSILRKTLRDGDKLFRYGGEEFIIILNRIDTQTTKLIAQRILNIIENNQLFYKGNSLKVTMSIGITKYVSGDTPENIITRADNALYESKHNGKNQFNVELLNGV